MNIRRSLEAVSAFAGLSFCAFGAGTTEMIVHRANVDLMLNAAYANPYTNVHDGVWSYMRTSGAGLDGERQLLPNLHTRTPLRGFGNGLVTAGDTGPAWILVNARGTNTINGTVNGGKAIPGGQLLMHPGSSHRAVLRFTVPRDGVYAASGYFDGAMTAQSGRIAGDVMVNGASVWSQTVTRNKDNADRGDERASFTTDDYDLHAGDTMELVIFNSDNYAGDCTGVNFDVYEKDCPVVFIDPSEVIAAKFTTGVPAQPFAGPHGEYWSLLATSNHLASLRALLTAGCFSRDSYSAADNVFVGANGSSNATNGGGFCRVQASTQDGFTRHPDGIDNIASVPGELWMHTGPISGDKFASVLRFQPGEAGIYAMNVNVRDMNSTGNGVKVRVLDRHGVLAEALVNVNVSSNQAAQIRIPARQMMRMDWLDVIVDAIGDVTGDGTGVTLAIKKLSAGMSEGWFDLNAELVGHFPGSDDADSPSVNPYVVEDVGSWGFGSLDSVSGVYTPLPSKATWTISGYGEAGWSTSGEPFIFQTVSSVPKQPYRGSIPLNRVLYALPKELNLRGDTNKCATVRYTVSTDGVYSVNASLRHLISDSSGSYAAVRSAGGRYPAGTGRICHSSSGFEDGYLEPYDIYLRQGQTLDLILWSADGHASGSGEDATGLFAAVRRDDPYGWILSLDIDGAAAGETAATFDGVGRIGFTDAQRWDSLHVANGAASARSAALYFADGLRSNVRAEISSSSGALVASAAGVAQNALTGDGVVSSSPSEVITLTLTGLTADADYELYLYGDGVEKGVFTVGDFAAACTDPWFSPGGADVVCLPGTADASGSLTISFHAGDSGNPARFSGLQLRGELFGDYVPMGMLLMIR